MHILIKSFCLQIYTDCPDPLPTEDPLCTPAVTKWEGEIEIQSGDVLLVRIDDSQLIHPFTDANETENEQTTQM